VYVLLLWADRKVSKYHNGQTEKSCLIDYCYCKHKNTHFSIRSIAPISHYSFIHIWLFLHSNPNPLFFIHSSYYLLPTIITTPFFFSLHWRSLQSYNTLIIIPTSLSFFFHPFSSFSFSFFGSSFSNLLVIFLYPFASITLFTYFLSTFFINGPFWDYRILLIFSHCHYDFIEIKLN
jgi:hypothetical protein